MYKEWDEDFPGGTVVKNPPANAGGTGSNPGRGTKIPPAAQCDQKKRKKKDVKLNRAVADFTFLI